MIITKGPKHENNNIIYNVLTVNMKPCKQFAQKP